MLTADRLNSDGEIRVSELRRFERELTQAETLLQTTSVGAIQIFDAHGVLLGTYPNTTNSLNGNEHLGYGVGLEHDRDGIVVVYHSKGLLEIDPEKRKAALQRDGLEGIMELIQQLNKEKDRLVFSEIVSEGETCFGTTLNGSRIELPADYLHGQRTTPFTAFGAPFPDAARMSYTRVPATESFGYITRLLRRYLEVAQEYSIGIQGT